MKQVEFNIDKYTIFHFLEIKVLKDEKGTHPGTSDIKLTNYLKLGL